MSYTKVKNDIIAAATNGTVGFASAKHGYLSELNDGDIDYPILLLTPPDKQYNLNVGGYDFYNIVLYAVALNEVNDDVTNNDERTDVWDDMDKKVQGLLFKLQETNEEYIVSSDVRIEPNAHQFNDDTILIKARFQLQLDLDAC